LKGQSEQLQVCRCHEIQHYAVCTSVHLQAYIVCSLIDVKCVIAKSRRCTGKRLTVKHPARYFLLFLNVTTCWIFNVNMCLAV